MSLSRMVRGTAARGGGRGVTSRPWRLLKPMKSIPIDTVDDNNWWPYAKQVTTGNREYHNKYSGTGVPIKLNVIKPRMAEEVREPPGQYHVACHVPYDHGDKYSLHKIDTSYNISTESIRPICLRVIVPAQTESESQKQLLKEPYIMQSYPPPLPNDDKYLLKNNK